MFVCNRGDTVSRRSPINKGVKPSPYKQSFITVLFSEEEEAEKTEHQAF